MMKSRSPSRHIKKSLSDKTFDIVNTIILGILLLLILYPLWFVVIASISEPQLVNSGKVIFFPRGITFAGYQMIFRFDSFWRGYRNTLFYVTVGTLINLTLTLTGAYALSRKELPIRRGVMLIITFTMIFNGGLIPTFLTVREYKLYDTVWALMIPNAISAYNLIVTRTFFESSIPDELKESAEIDGCSDTRFFFSIVLPLSSAIIAVIGLFYAVGHWNSWFNALIYLKDTTKNPLQMELRELLISAQSAAQTGNLEAESLMERQRAADLMKFGVIIVSTLPIICVYPFIQRFFIKGVMIGAIKG